jgi:hypothetical protein
MLKNSLSMIRIREDLLPQRRTIDQMVRSR